MKIHITGEHDMVEVTKVTEVVPEMMYLINVETEQKYLDTASGYSMTPEYSGVLVTLMARDGESGIVSMCFEMPGHWTVKTVALKYEYEIILINDSFLYSGRELEGSEVVITDWVTK